MKSLVFIFIVILFPKLSGAAPTTTKWHTVKNERATALLIHGLNMRPSKMDALIRVYNDAKVSVLNLTLEGHGLDFEAFLNVTQDKWVANLNTAYKEVSAYSTKRNLPVYLFAYSTGAAVALAAEARHPDIVFNKRVLMAPAISMNWSARLIKLLFPFESLSLFSKNHKDFRQHDSTPIVAYKSLFALADEVIQSPKEILNRTPTLIIIDPKDELVDFESLKLMKHEKQLSQWELFSVFTDVKFSIAKAPHHSIFHEFFTGPIVWSKLSKKLKNFLDTET